MVYEWTEWAFSNHIYWWQSYTKDLSYELNTTFLSLHFFYYFLIIGLIVLLKKNASV